MLLLAPGVALAHAILVSALPGPGQQLAAPPTAVSASFSEPLDKPLSSMALTGPEGRRVVARLHAVDGERLVLTPLRRLARGVYEVSWHSVSADDGHVLDGSYYFGVSTISPAGEVSSQGGPLAGSGWLRILLRAALNATLLLFCGGVFCSVLLARGREPASWLLPDNRVARPGAPNVRRLWRRVVMMGVAAVLTALASTLADAANAGQGLSRRALHAYLLSNVSGAAWIVMLGALTLAVALAALRAPPGASAFAVLALAGLTLSGHANSAHPRGVAIASDLAHLVAASVWIGGIAQIAWTWLPRLTELAVAARRGLMQRVLPRFGRIALPAFLTIVLAGVLDAVVQLGSPAALWSSGYGRVLIVKATLVGAIALASYTHALRIRPRLLGSYSQTDARLDRRHWRLLGIEPVIGAAVVLAAALLIAYPPPHRALTRASGVFRGLSATVGAPSASVSAAKLSVAEEAGPDIVAAFLSPAAGGLRVQVHALNLLERPIAVQVHVPDATVTGSCGRGCIDLRLTGSPRVLVVELTVNGKRYRTRLPIRFDPGSGQLAKRLLRRVKTSEPRIRTAVIHESLGAGSGPASDTTYELQAPNRFAYQLSRAGKRIGDTIIIGRHEWIRGAHQKQWQASAYGGGGPAFAATSYLGWWNDYANNPRVLDLHRAGSIQVADIATVSEVQGIGPVWLRLRLDLTHRRLLRLRMITAAHFMTQTWAPSPQRISPPPTREVEHSR